ncbi:MAG TPA: hypothetical protein PLN31_09555 [Azoarcus taiwanensis]|nr:hypothetical protein [Azoarcus taiwanensis]
MERELSAEFVEGEIGLVIDYSPGKTPAVAVLQAAMSMVQSLDRLDSVLLSSVDTSLEPVSVLNDVQHSSLKMLLARVLRNVPDEMVANLDWRPWVGNLLVKGKYALLQRIDADAPQVMEALDSLKEDYKGAPGRLIGYHLPSVSDVMDALDGVAKARSAIAGHAVRVETALGDVSIPDVLPAGPAAPQEGVTQEITNSGVEYFKVKAPDMLGTSQWTVQRNNRSVRVEMLHRGWIDAYHRREKVILPGDSLKCRYEERIVYDQNGTELERRLAIIEVLDIITPPVQGALI